MNRRLRWTAAAGLGVVVVALIAALDTGDGTVESVQPGPFVAAVGPDDAADAVLLSSWRPLAGPAELGRDAFRFTNGGSTITVVLSDTEPKPPAVSRKVSPSRWATIEEDPPDLGELLGKVVAVPLSEFRRAVASRTLTSAIYTEATVVPLPGGELEIVVGEGPEPGFQRVVDLRDAVTGRTLGGGLQLDPSGYTGTWSTTWMLNVVDPAVASAIVSTSAGRLTVTPFVDPVSGSSIVAAAVPKEHEIYGWRLLDDRGGTLSISLGS